MSHLFPNFPLCHVKGELVTASKAIIEKEYQPRVIVSKQGPNPFTKLTDREMDEYRREVEQNQKGPEGKPDSMKESQYGTYTLVIPPLCNDKNK